MIPMNPTIWSAPGQSRSNIRLALATAGESGMSSTHRSPAGSGPNSFDAGVSGVCVWMRARDGSTDCRWLRIAISLVVPTSGTCAPAVDSYSRSLFWERRYNKKDELSGGLMERYLLSASGKVHSPKCTTFANLPTAERVETVPDDADLADCRACPDAFSDESGPVTEQYPFRVECLRLWVVAGRRYVQRSARALVSDV